MKIPREKLYLRNKKLEQNPVNQKKGNLYKSVLNSFKKIGQVNPLICVEDGDKYKVCVGNNRFLAGCELGFKEFDIVIVPDENRDKFREIMNNYKTVNLQ